jgi:hypothetical protein
VISEKPIKGKRNGNADNVAENGKRDITDFENGKRGITDSARMREYAVNSHH